MRTIKAMNNRMQGMLQKTMLILILGFSLSGCERVTDALFDEIGINEVPVSSRDQDHKAQLLYEAIQKKDIAEISALTGSQVQQQLKDSPNLLDSVFKIMPQESSTSMSIVNTSQSLTTQDGKTTSVTYLYDYPNMQISLRVVFPGYDGDSTIIGFWVTKITKAKQDQKVEV